MASCGAYREYSKYNISQCATNANPVGVVESIKVNVTSTRLVNGHIVRPSLVLPTTAGMTSVNPGAIVLVSFAERIQMIRNQDATDIATTGKESSQVGPGDLAYQGFTPPNYYPTEMVMTKVRPEVNSLTSTLAPRTAAGDGGRPPNNPRPPSDHYGGFPTPPGGPGTPTPPGGPPSNSTPPGGPPSNPTPPGGSWRSKTSFWSFQSW